MNLNIIQMVECPRAREPVDIDTCAACLLNSNVGSNTISCLWEDIGEEADAQAWKDVCPQCEYFILGKSYCRVYDDLRGCSKLEAHFWKLIRGKLAQWRGVRDEGNQVCSS